MWPGLRRGFVQPWGVESLWFWCTTSSRRQVTPRQACGALRTHDVWSRLMVRRASQVRRHRPAVQGRFMGSHPDAGGFHRSADGRDPVCQWKVRG